MLIGHVTSLIPYKDSSRPHRLAVVEAKSRKDAAAAARRLLSGLSCPSVCPRQQNCNIGFRDIGLNAPAAVAASRPPLRRAATAATADLFFVSVCDQHWIYISKHNFV